MTGAAQLVMGQSVSRSFLALQNIGSHAMNVEFGSARATCAISGGKVTSGGFTITNAGFNFTSPPVIRFLGGGGGPGNQGAPYLGLNQPNGMAPSRPARAHATLSGGAVSAIVLDDPGAGYLIAPFVFLFDNDLDPYGCAVPSSTSGLSLPAGMTAPIAWEGTTCPTDPIAVIGTTSDILVVRWMD
jgi:hypothetical protein